jgi:hypothetical protein
MAARLNKLDTERVLERIKLSQLVNLLQNNAMGTLKTTNGEGKGQPYELSKSRIQSAMFLIERKLARAVAPQDLNVNGNMTVIFDDPTQRPPDSVNGYHRKPLDHDAS